MARVFISHASKDAEQAARMLDWLRAQGFEGVFLDFDKVAGIAPGADWERTLYREISRAEAVLLILTANWFGSKWCFAEYTQARALGKAIFPLIESPEGETYIAPDIQHLDLRKDREGGLARLATELTRIARDARDEFPWDESRPPFPGLLAYDESDAAIYFGRDDDIRRLIERLNARRAQGGAKLVALLGGSGSGKSSLMRAGVLPRLEKRDKRNWIVLPPFRPQRHPIDELAQAVAQAMGPRGDWRQVRDALAAKNPEQSLHDLARDLRAAQATNDAHILISIDQAEELFSTADKAEAGRFWALLNVMLGEHLPFIVLLALRSDYLAQLQQAPGLQSPFEDVQLKPLPLERVGDIIEGPACVAGLTVDNALVAAAMRDAATDDALPLLAFALRELYDRFGSSGGLTIAAYLALGDEKANLSPLENAVRQRAEQVLAEAEPTPEQLQALKDAFVPAMVRVNAGGEYVRRPARLDTLPAQARPLLERLAKARLLILQLQGDATVVEVAHEALLRKWPLLRGWLDEEREFLVGKAQLEQDLSDWQRAAEDQKSEALLSGLKLTRARTWLAGKPQQLSKVEQDFIGGSIEHETRLARKASRQRRLAFSSLMVLGLLAALGGPWAYSAFNKQQSIAREASRTDIHGEVLAYAVVAGGTAYDSYGDRMEGKLTSAYSTPLVEKLGQKDKSLIEALQDVHKEVAANTKGSQRPFLSTSMDGNVYLWRQPQSRAKRAVVVSVDDVGMPALLLSAPRHDGDAVAGVLRDAGFANDEIVRLHNVTGSDIENVVTRSCRALHAGGGPAREPAQPAANTVLIFFFSGHGFQSELQNYLLPAIGRNSFGSEADARGAGLRVDALRQKIADCAAASVLILDTHFPAIPKDFFR